MTNDRGEFRIFNLPAGDYYLVASKAHVDGAHRAPPPPFGYATTYYPGSTKRTEANAVTVRSGRDTTATTFTLVRQRLATVSVTAVNSHGATLGGDARAYLRRLDAVEMSSSSRDSRREDGGFVFRGVEPGDYSLIVSTSYKREESAYLKVSVDQSDISLKVQTNTGARVSGRVIVDGRRGAHDASREAGSDHSRIERRRIGGAIDVRLPGGSQRWLPGLVFQWSVPMRDAGGAGGTARLTRPAWAVPCRRGHYIRGRRPGRPRPAGKT